MEAPGLCVLSLWNVRVPRTDEEVKRVRTFEVKGKSSTLYLSSSVNQEGIPTRAVSLLPWFHWCSLYSLERNSIYIFENLNNVTNYVNYILSTKVQTGPKVGLSNIVFAYVCKTLD